MRAGAVLVAAAAALAIGLAACAGPPISPTPAPVSGVYQQVALHGGSLVGAVSGDAGCAVADQAPLATHVRFHIPASSGDVQDVYLFVYADRAAFDRQASSFASCRAAYAASQAAGGRPVRAVEVSPYRAFGPAWSDETLGVIRDALTVAAGNGG